MYNQSNIGSVPLKQASAGGRWFIPAVAVSILALSVAFSVVILNFGTGSFAAIALGIAAVPAVYVIVTRPEKGILVLLALAYVIMFFGKLGTDFPVGTVMDAIVFLLVIGFLLKQKYVRDWSILKGGTSAVVIAWMGYNLLEALNPSASSMMAWLYAVRPIAFVTLTYFLFRFYIRDVKFIRVIIKLWILLSVIAALYALKQEYFGFAKFEVDSIKADPITSGLYFIGNHWRKPSIFSDPVAFAYNMVISALLCFSLATGALPAWKKATLALLGCLFLFSMLYSGTRGAYVMLPVAYVLFLVLRYNKKLMLISAVIFFAAGALIFIPTSNYTLYRFQTAFKPAADASFNVRAANQKKIQPYILRHPIGGGVGSTGVWGRRFAPYSYLANFPPDSGYVRVAVELGWVGLFIFCTMMFVVMRAGISSYFRIADPELKSYCLAMIMVVFALNFGNYPQEALVQYPANIYFYLAVALFSVTLKLDRGKRTLIKQQTFLK